MSNTITAQNSDSPKPISNTYYLQNCFVVKQPGTILSGQSVIIRDGFVIDVGPGLNIPFDAQVIKTDSMYVYAGFIDGYSNTGIAKPENRERPKITDPGNPPNDVAGITPQVEATDLFKSSDKSVGDMRSSGFGISHVSPRGLMLPGKSALYLLSDGSNDKLLLKSSENQNFQLEANRGSYPATTIAVMAKFRDLYKNAAIAGSHVDKYTLNPAGLSRPDYSKELMALYPVTNKKTPLYFVARNTKDVHKALSLKDELGFDLVLTEVKQGWHYMDRIKKGNVPIFLSLELPDEDKKDDKSGEKKDSTLSKDVKKVEKKDSTLSKDVKKVENKEVDPAKDAFDKKKEMSVKEYLSQAATFEKNGIKFGFSFLSVKPSDIKKNVRRLIENGLSENTALAALTTHPAQMLGISQMAGTVEKGKIANLVITDKSYFDEKSNIKYVFVDGKKFDYSEKPKKADAKSSEEGKMVGAWSYTVETPGSTQKGKMNIKKVSGEYKITVKDDSSPNEEDTANNVSVNGNNITFYINANMGQPVKIDFDLKFEDKKYSGSVSVGQFGSFPIKGDYEGEPKSF
ncbi:MAG: amidohydrolase family protein [Saprospiraceae bacterium]